ncbi:hypothetical protein BGX26_010812, partial [Mortierella sp. AD094]
MSFFNFSSSSSSSNNQEKTSSSSSSSRSRWPVFSVSISVALGSNRSGTSSSSGSTSSNKRLDSKEAWPHQPPAPTNNKQQSLRSVIKSSEREYKTKAKEAETKYNLRRQEAEMISRHEGVICKAKRDAVEKTAKQELQVAKDSATESLVQSVLELVKNSIIDAIENQLREQQQQQQQQQQQLVKGGTLLPPSALLLSHGTASRYIKEDPEIKEWVDYAAEILQPQISNRNVVRQRLLEEILGEITTRQVREQQKAIHRARELEQQLDIMRKEYIAGGEGRGGGAG